MILLPFIIECDARRAPSCPRHTQIIARDVRHAEVLFVEGGGKVETVDTGGGYKQKHTCQRCVSDAARRDDTGRSSSA